MEVWRRLLAAADWFVLRPERRALKLAEREAEATRLFLKWIQEGDRKEGPGFIIVKVYYTLYLAFEHLVPLVESTTSQLYLCMDR
jgi:hypothetical protein